MVLSFNLNYFVQKHHQCKLDNAWHWYYWRELIVFLFFIIISESSDGGFHFYRTNTYKLHYFESASMVKFILITDENTGDMKEFLKKVYEYYTNFVIKNPLFELNSTIDCLQFIEHLDNEVKDWKSPSSHK